MMIKDFFRKPKYVTVKSTQPSEKKDIPEGLWLKCDRCGEILYVKELGKNLKVCSRCAFHFRLNAKERIGITVDEGSFNEFNREIGPGNPLGFPNYEEKLEKAIAATGIKEAVVTGEAKINGNPAIVAVMDSNFIMGSMSSMVGEKITLAIEKSIEKKLPIVIFSASGGARMQEGIVSLMQMAKTSAALHKLSEEGLLFVSVLTDPTTGGVTASFASLGDINIAEPNVTIGFAGPRVIEQTIKQKLPEGFQKAEFLLKHGLLDKVVPRKELKDVLGKILELHR